MSIWSALERLASPPRATTHLEHPDRREQHAAGARGGGRADAASVPAHVAATPYETGEGGTLALLRAGTGSLPDLLAPSGVEIGRDHLCLDGRYARTFALTTYPRTVALGWLHRLVASGEHLDVSLHLVPLDTALAQAELTTRMTQLRSSQLQADKSGRLDDAATGTALGDCRRVRQALQEGHDVLLAVSLYVTVYGSSLADLNARATRVQRLVGALMAQTRPAVWQAQAGLHSTLPAATDCLRVRRTLPASSVVTMFPFTAPRLEMEGGVLWGRNSDTGALVLVNPWSQTNANVAVLATSGAGKSYTIKREVLRTLPLGIHVLVIDPDDEYVGLASALHGQVVRLGPGSPHRLNPLALPRSPRGLALLPLETWATDAGNEEGDAVSDRRPISALDPLAAHTASLVPLLEVLLAGNEARLSPREKGALETALAACYRAAGITANPATHARRPPTFTDLAAALVASGDPEGLADRLQRYCTGPYASVFTGQSTVDLDNRLVVFSLGALSEETTESEVRTAVMLLIAAHVLRTAQLDRRQRRRIIVDEAHVLARFPAGDRFLATLARRARKYGLGVTAISQQLEDFLATTSGQAVLKNSSTRLLLLQTAETLTALEQHVQLTPVERTRLLTCARGEGLLLVGRQRVFVRLEASPDEHRLCHTDAAHHEAAIAAVAPRPAISTPPAHDTTGVLTPSGSPATVAPGVPPALPPRGLATGPGPRGRAEAGERAAAPSTEHARDATHEDGDARAPRKAGADPPQHTGHDALCPSGPPACTSAPAALALAGGADACAHHRGSRRHYSPARARGPWLSPRGDPVSLARAQDSTPVQGAHDEGTDTDDDTPPSHDL